MQNFSYLGRNYLKEKIIGDRFRHKLISSMVGKGSFEG